MFFVPSSEKGLRLALLPARQTGVGQRRIDCHIVVVVVFVEEGRVGCPVVGKRVVLFVAVTAASALVGKLGLFFFDGMPGPRIFPLGIGRAKATQSIVGLGLLRLAAEPATHGVWNES